MIQSGSWMNIQMIETRVERRSSAKEHVMIKIDHPFGRAVVKQPSFAQTCSTSISQFP
jgi:hypothetical protein